MNKFTVPLVLAVSISTSCLAGVVFHIDVNDALSDIQSNDSPTGPFTVTVQIELETAADSLAAFDFDLKFDQNEVTATSASLLKPAAFFPLGTLSIDAVNGSISKFAAGALLGGFSDATGFDDAVHGPAIVNAGSIDFTPVALANGPSDTDFFVQLAADGGVFDAFANDISPNVSTQFGSVSAVPEPRAFTFLAVVTMALVGRRYSRKSGNALLFNW